MTWPYRSVDEEIEAMQLAALRARIRANQRTRSTKDRLDALEDEVDRLRLVVRGLFEALRANGTLDEVQFSEALRRVDLEDGVEDGRLRRPSKTSSSKKPKAPVRRRWTRS